MAKYKLRYVDPDDGTKFIGDPVETDVLPEKGDVHTIAGKKYTIAKTPTMPKTKASEVDVPQDVHVRVKGQQNYPRTRVGRGY